MRLTLEMRAERPCIRCQVPTPLTGLRHLVTCHACGAHLDVEKDLAEGRTGGVRCWFGGYYDAVADALLDPGDRPLGGTDEEEHIKLRRKALACACGAPLTLPAAPGREITCAGLSCVDPRALARRRYRTLGPSAALRGR